MKKIPLLLFLFFLKSGIAQDTIQKLSGDIVIAKVTEITTEEIHYKRWENPDGPSYIELKTNIEFIKYKSGFKEEFTKPTAPVVLVDPKSAANVAVEPAKTLPAATETNADYYDPNAKNTITANPEPGASQGQMETLRGKFRYKYNDKRIGEVQMQTILMKTNDKELINMVQNAKNARKMQYIGFAAIPLGLISIGLLSNQNQQTVGTTVTAGLFCFAVGVACPIVSGVYKHKRTVNNKKAVALYNQKY